MSCTDSLSVATLSESKSDTEAVSGKIPLTATPGEHAAEIIKAFAIAERRRNFHFLAWNSHRYMNGEDLIVDRADPERSNAYIKVRKLDSSSLAGSTWYVLIQPKVKVEEKMLSIRFDSRNGTIDEGSIDGMEAMDAEDTKSWMSLRAWMKKHLECHDECDWTQRGGAQLQLEKQVTWWNNNGKHFRLLDLPPELRKLIYVEILGGGIILPQVQGNRVTLGRGFTVGTKDRPGSKLDPDIEHPNIQILRTSRQIYEEATDAVWEGAIQRFNWTSDFSEFNIHHIQHFGHPKVLTRVQFELPASLYFELIGISTQSDWPFQSSRLGDEAVAIEALKNLQTVRSVDFRFISPYHENAIDPWIEDSVQLTSVGHSCQKTWIHWFFTLGFEQLRDWTYKGYDKENKITIMKTKITMSGCIKTSTREEWEAIFANEGTLDRSGRRMSYAGNMEIAKTYILETNKDSLPIQCCCSIPCYSPDTISHGYQQFASSDLRNRVEGLEEAIQESYFSFDD